MKITHWLRWGELVWKTTFDFGGDSPNNDFQQLAFLQRWIQCGSTFHRSQLDFPKQLPNCWGWTSDLLFNWHPPGNNHIIYIHMYMYMYMYTYTVYVCICICTCICTCMYMYMYVYTYICIYICICICICIYRWKRTNLQMICWTRWFSTAMNYQRRYPVCLFRQYIPNLFGHCKRHGFPLAG